MDQTHVMDIEDYDPAKIVQKLADRAQQNFCASRNALITSAALLALPPIAFFLPLENTRPSIDIALQRQFNTMSNTDMLSATEQLQTAMQSDKALTSLTLKTGDVVDMTRLKAETIKIKQEVTQDLLGLSGRFGLLALGLSAAFAGLGWAEQKSSQRWNRKLDVINK